MTPIRPCPLPAGALLSRYADNGYADCWTADVARAVSHAQFVEAFYTGGPFRIERLLLRLFLSKPSTDAQVRQLASGQVNTFAAWRVEDRSADQLLLCDIAGRTRSWLMVLPLASAPEPSTRLFFGSAVVSLSGRRSDKPSMGFLFVALLGFHKLYSRALLGSARARVMR